MKNVQELRISIHKGMIIVKTYQIHLIRHGLTDGNTQGRYIGRTDLPLSGEGIRELKDLAEKYEYPRAELYYTSPMLRCIQTMNLLYPGTDCFEVPGLREVDFGKWEGKTAQELSDDPLFRQWLEEGGTAAPPEGESARDFSQRVCASFENIVDNMMRTGITSAVIVAHGGVMMTILAAYGLPRANFYDWLTGNGRGYSLRASPNLWMSGRVVEVYDTIPEGLPPAEEDDQRLIIDLGREAANRAYGHEGIPEE